MTAEPVTEPEAVDVVTGEIVEPTPSASAQVVPLPRPEGPGRDLAQLMTYARALAEARLLPAAYRQRPADVLLAIEYADALGIPRASAFTSIHIVDGKPTLSAQLMGALVRRAGHRLRVRVEDGPSAVAEIVRSDDPDYAFTARWDMNRAKTAGLLGKDNWSHHPVAMLKARALAEVARDACPEVLAGIAYTPEELDPSTPLVVDLAGEPGAYVPPADAPGEQWPAAATKPQLTALWTRLKTAGLTDKDAALAYLVEIVGHPLASTRDLTREEASLALDALGEAAQDKPDTARAASGGENACPHGMPFGDQPDPWLGGRVACPQCASAAAETQPARAPADEEADTDGGA